MLTTTTSFSRRASSTRLRWPACSAPIVGTSPIDLPSRRQRRDASSIAPGCPKTTTPLAAVPDLFPVLCRSRSIGRVLVLRSRELPVADVVRIRGGRARDLLRKVRVPLDELRRFAARQPEDVVQHEHLPVGRGTGADPDGRNAEGVRDRGRQLAWHAFEHDAEGTGLL